MTKHLVLASLVVVVGSFVSCGSAKAASYQHMDTLALRIQANSAKLHQEFRLHYSHTPGYSHLLSDARSLYLRAKHVHSIVHVHGGLHHVASDLRVIDRSYHHLEEVLHQVEFGTHHGHSGHVHGDTGHVHQLMKQIESDIHHLRADIKSLTQPIIGHGTVYPGHGTIYPYGHGITQQPRRQRTITRPRNFGEIRSGWKTGLKHF